MYEYSSAKTSAFSTTIVTKRDYHKRERAGFILECPWTEAKGGSEGSMIVTAYHVRSAEDKLCSLAQSCHVTAVVLWRYAG